MSYRVNVGVLKLQDTLFLDQLFNVICAQKVSVNRFTKK